jgi:hypothetical protein
LGIIQTASRPHRRSATYASGGGGGSIADGQAITITGSGFGTNVVTQDFLGGLNNPIEAAANDTMFTSLSYTDWNTYSDNAAHVSSTRAFTRNKSLNVTYPTFNAYGLVRNFGTYKSIYTRQIIYLDSGIYVDGQIKINRYVGCPVSTIPKTGDGTTNANGNGPGGNSVHEDYRLPNTLLHDFWVSGPGQYLTVQATGHPGDEPGFTPDSLLQFNKWVILETVFTPDTTVGAGDGTFKVRCTDGVDGTIIYGTTTQTIGPRVFWAGSDPAFEWLVVQFYIGNNLQQTGVGVYLDPEHYVAVNAASSTTPKFILAGDASTYTACNKHTMAIQEFDTWADTSIHIPAANKGKLTSLDNGSAYFYPMSAINTPINENGYSPT